MRFSSYIQLALLGSILVYFSEARTAGVETTDELRKNETLRSAAIKNQYEHLYVMIDDMRLTAEQLDMMTDKGKPSNERRKKRGILDFDLAPLRQWPMPIHYKIDSIYTEYERERILDALDHWMDNTCIRFHEIPLDEEFLDNHILFTYARLNTCWSFVGMIGRWPNLEQVIHLDPGHCLNGFGMAVHAIGHALGRFHEHQRHDRDEAVDVGREHIAPDIKIDTEHFEKNIADVMSEDYDDNYGLPYDYGSIMHFPGVSGIKSWDPLYQMNMGQLTGLSFLDKKLMNLAYCEDACLYELLDRPCEQGGFQNPNDCSKCICPDGFSGIYCDELALQKGDYDCGSDVELEPDRMIAVTSPGYEFNQEYGFPLECNWRITAPLGYRLQLTFEGDFSIYCKYEACQHWVEVKFKQDLGLEGARFCCEGRPDVSPIVSESNEMMILFRSNLNIPDRLWGFRRGFFAFVASVPDDEISSGDDYYD